MTIENEIKKLTAAVAQLCEVIAGAADTIAANTITEVIEVMPVDQPQPKSEPAQNQVKIADLHELAHKLGDLEQLEEILEALGVETVNQLDADQRREMAAEIRARL